MLLDCFVQASLQDCETVLQACLGSILFNLRKSLFSHVAAEQKSYLQNHRICRGHIRQCIQEMFVVASWEEGENRWESPGIWSHMLAAC
jgi:hypothetical protein